jgi:ATPase subunit of ABC transporter with duplicated ATPase domains
MLGFLPVDSGIINRKEGFYVYLDQEYSLIQPSKTVFEQVQSWNKTHLPEAELRTILAQNTFSNERLNDLCSVLSGGERLRLALICLHVYSEHPLGLFLDEPTNNLDLDHQDLLAKVLQSYKGLLVIVSHDSLFLNELNLEETIEIQTS